MSPATTQCLDSNESQRLNAAISRLFPSIVHIQQSQTLLGHVHSLQLLALSNGHSLLLKGPPSSGTPLLRHEKRFLETEARFLALMAQSANPCIPQLYYYSPPRRPNGSAYLIRQCMKGTTLAEMDSQLSSHQRADIDRHLGFLASTVAQNVAPAFGTLPQVAAGAGRRSWREAFGVLLEEVLQDAEDMFIHLPYADIRDEMGRLGAVLDEVTLPRLVVVALGRPSHVLLNDRLRQVSGMVDFGSALWGDVLMAEVFEGKPLAVLEGAGLPLDRTDGESIRLMMYDCYRSICRITQQYYRDNDEAKEFDARRHLMTTIRNMNTTEWHRR
ncbi:Aminoglycoside phosphotransferase [Penicillium capsulatum]|uniref:Aminoglycoside phosphotransferase n=1 Tax=Penicillium capsulatum TaxID=69766 RepID=A0A9W9LGR8_9EURO|nr:Aminoglycoside phosphotransferase [Penicillium capsulatum]KAJ6105829.1 Aminoglycoside phosphotransferase [Penicillium capsulatum]